MTVRRHLGVALVLALVAAAEPAVAHSLAEVEGELGGKERYFQAVDKPVTTDPVRDTPQILQDYGPAHGLDPVNWTFLTTSPDQPEDTTRQLAKAFGHTFTPGEDGMQMHGVVTHVIDQDGRWRANLHGLGFEPTNLLVYLNALVNRAQAPHPHPEASFWERLRGLLGA